MIQATELTGLGGGSARLEAARDGTRLATAAFATVAILGVLARPLLPIDETRYLAVAWEMRLHGDWIVPHLNGLPYSHKPPLLFWLINAVWAVTGVSETAARLVGPAFGLASIWATSRLARRLWPDDQGVGGRAAMVLTGTAAFTAFAGLTMFDAMLTLAVVSGVYALVTGAGASRGWIGFGAALAFGVLAKGPVVLVHLMPLGLAAPLWAQVTPGQGLRGTALALCVGLGLVSLWLLPAMFVGGPDYRNAVLWTQSAGRMAGSFAHARPWWFFLLLLPALLWPFAWSPQLWARVRRLDLREDTGVRLPVIWACSTLILFSLMSGKQAHYLLPALPAAALIFARAMRGLSVAALPAAVPLLAGAIASFSAALGFTPDSGAFSVLQPPAVMAAVGIACLGLAALTFRLRGIWLATLGLGLVALVNLAFLVGAPGRAYDAAAIATLVAPSDYAGVAVVDDENDGEFTFAARATNPVAHLSRREADDWLAEDPGRAAVARLDRDHPSGAPRATVLYRGHPYGIWGGTEVSRGPGVR